jgi:hypothetical protein
LDEKIGRPAEPMFLGDKRRVYELTEVVEEPRIDAIVGGRLQDEITRKVTEVAERIAREQFPGIAERVIREEIENLKKSIHEEQ